MLAVTLDAARAARRPIRAHLELLEPDLGALVVLPYVRRWATLPDPVAEAAHLLAEPADRLPRPLRGYAAALRELVEAVTASGRLDAAPDHTARPSHGFGRTGHPPLGFRATGASALSVPSSSTRGASVRPNGPFVGRAVTSGALVGRAARRSGGPTWRRWGRLRRSGREGCRSSGRTSRGATGSGGPSGSGEACVRIPKVLRGPLVAVLGVALSAVPGGDVTAPSSGVDAARLPATARRYLPLVTDLTAQQCPELPPLWVVAQVEAESGWDPAAVGDGVAGLLQFDQLTWMAAGGPAWSARSPRPGDDVLDPRRPPAGGGPLAVHHPARRHGPPARERQARLRARCDARVSRRRLRPGHRQRLGGAAGRGGRLRRALRSGW